MSNDIVNLINQLISETITLKNEIKKLNTRLNNKVVKQMIQDDIIFYIYFRVPIFL
jgi:hypothetical protein